MLISVLLAALALTSPAVIDGDSLRPKIRLYGIDAPEARQQCLDGVGRCYACGKQATAFLASLTHGKAIRCERRDTDRYGRTVAQCFDGETDLGEAMIRTGWAVPYARYLKGTPDTLRTYERAHADAQADGRGLHQGQYAAPREWRKGSRLECE